MDKLLLVGSRRAQKGAGSKPIKRRNRALSFAVGILVALLIAVGMFFLLISQQ
jgi:capsular polysaccharide biosynthesis protein